VPVGCLGSNDPPLGLRKIEITNGADEEVNVHLLVRKSGTLVYDEVITLGTELGEKYAEVTKDWMGDREYYEMTAETTVGGQQLSASSNSDSLVGDNRDFSETSCFELSVSVFDDEIGMAHGFHDSCELPAAEAHD
jgi:hypothetical protein